MRHAVTTAWVPIVALALAGCATTTPPEEDPVFLKLTDLEARLIRIERVVDNQSLIEMVNRVDQLQSEVQAVRGEIETLAFRTDNADERQRDLYVDVDNRLQELDVARQQLEMMTSELLVEEEEEEPPPASPVLPGSDQDNYQAAFNLLRDGRYEESAGAFEQFLAVFPSSPLADNAQYWLAETIYVQRQYTSALPAFQRVIDEYPSSSKLPDALLKIGYCNYELQQWTAARDALQRVVREFPATTAARLATQRLERIMQEQG